MTYYRVPGKTHVDTNTTWEKLNDLSITLYLPGLPGPSPTE